MRWRSKRDGGDLERLSVKLGDEGCRGNNKAITSSCDKPITTTISGVQGIVPDHVVHVPGLGLPWDQCLHVPC